MTKERALELVKSDYSDEQEDDGYIFEEEVKETVFEETESGMFVTCKWNHAYVDPANNQEYDETTYLVTDDEDVVVVPA